MNYRLGVPIPLFFLRIRRNSLVSGLNISVEVKDAVSGASLLASTPVPEISPGIYSYLWFNSISAFTQCIEIYTVGNQKFSNTFVVDDLAQSSVLQGVEILAEVSPSNTVEAIINSNEAEAAIESLVQMNETLSNADLLAANLSSASLEGETQEANLDAEVQADPSVNC